MLPAVNGQVGRGDDREQDEDDCRPGSAQGEADRGAAAHTSRPKPASQK
jgi:hypothetical protein